jgi:hypothetical protein
MLAWMQSFAVVLVIVPGALLGSAMPASTRDSEEQLLARIQSERNPIRKAKDQIRLGRMKLDQAIVAYGQGNAESGERLLAAFLGQMNDAWQTLHNSGRNAARQPQGFKELDIALREDARLLEDLGRRVSYFERVPIVKVEKEVEEVRSEVLRALFPALQPSAPGKHFLRSSQSATSW